MKSYLQVLASRTYETAPSVLIAFDSQRYLFNCGEGTQRLCAEKKIKFSKLGHVFTTRIGWDTCGGLPGFLLGLSENQGIGTDRKVTSIHGPPNMNHFLASLRHFVRRSTLYIDTFEVDKPYADQRQGFPGEQDILPSDTNKAPQGGVQEYGSDQDYYFQDENLKIKSVIIYPDGRSPTRQTDSVKRNLSQSPDGDVPPKKKVLNEDNAGTAMAAEINDATYDMEDIDDGKIDKDLFKLEVVKRMFASRDDIPIKEKLKVLSELVQRDNEVSTMVQEREILRQLYAKSREDAGQPVSDVLGAPDSELNREIEKEIDDLYDSKRSHAITTKLPPISGVNNCVVCYICEGPKVKGKFHPELAKQFKVAKGKDYGKLYKGEPVLNADGVLIHPSQCMDKDRPGSRFIIIDVPSVDFIDAVISNEELKKHYYDDTKPQQESYDESIACIVHFLDDEVVENTKYAEWTKKFGPNTQHIIISKKHCSKSTLYSGFAKHYSRLNAMDDQIFKLPYLEDKELPLIPEFGDAKIARRLTTFHMEPIRKLDETLEKPEEDYNPYKEIESGRIWEGVDPEYVKAAKVIKDSHQDYRHHKTQSPGDSLLVTTLGTGSAIPSKYRNVSSTLIHDVKNQVTMLFDAGEGTLGQIFRRYKRFSKDSPYFNLSKEYDGAPDFDTLFEKLQVIFISHLHADHHLGLVALLVARRQLQRKRDEQGPSSSIRVCNLFIVGPPQIRLWLEEYQQFEDLGLSTVIFVSTEAVRSVTSNSSIKRTIAARKARDIDSEGTISSVVRGFRRKLMMFGPEDESLEVQQLLGVTNPIGLTSVVAIPVEHSSYSYAFTVTHKDGYKIAYSGDCRPSKGLEESGRDCDVLVHEATFGGDECGVIEAVKRNHTTTVEAIALATRMNARSVILTHFSQRFPKIPNVVELADLLERQRESDGDVAIVVAFDLMTVQVGSASKVERIVAPLALLCPDEVEGAAEDGE